MNNNIFSVANDTSDAAQELTTAHEYQRRAGRRAACLMLVLVVVVAIVLLAVSELDSCLRATLISEDNRYYLDTPFPCLWIYL